MVSSFGLIKKANYPFPKGNRLFYWILGETYSAPPRISRASSSKQHSMHMGITTWDKFQKAAWEEKKRALLNLSDKPQCVHEQI